MWTRVESNVWLAFLFMSIWLGSAQAQTAAVNQKIDAKVMADLRQNARTTLYVVLSEQGNVSSATAIRNWRLRGESVVESLKEVATRTQRPILNFLATANAEVTPFWIVNTIKVTTADEQLIRWLAAMPDVAAIKPIRHGESQNRSPALKSPLYRRSNGVWRAFELLRSGISLALKVKASL